MIKLLLFVNLFVPGFRNSIRTFEVNKKDSVSFMTFFSIKKFLVPSKRKGGEFVKTVVMYIEIYGDKKLLTTNLKTFEVPVNKMSIVEGGLQTTVKKAKKYKVYCKLSTEGGVVLMEKKENFKLFKYISSIIPISVRGDTSSYTLTYNDSLLHFMIYSDTQGVALYKLTDRAGRIVIKDTLLLDKGRNTFVVNPGNIERGIYTLKLKFKGQMRKLTVTKTNTGIYSKKDWDVLVKLVNYIFSVGELDTLRHCAPDKRTYYWNLFWKRRDPTPLSAENEALDEFWSRVEYAEEHFGSGLTEGALSDRGTVYINLGPPDEVENHPFDLNAPAYVIWYYYSKNLKFTFMDKKGVGDYELVDPPAYTLPELFRR